MIDIDKETENLTESNKGEDGSELKAAAAVCAEYLKAHGLEPGDISVAENPEIGPVILEVGADEIAAERAARELVRLAAADEVPDENRKPGKTKKAKKKRK